MENTLINKKLEIPDKRLFYKNRTIKILLRLRFRSTKCEI